MQVHGIFISSIYTMLMQTFGVNTQSRDSVVQGRSGLINKLKHLIGYAKRGGGQLLSRQVLFYQGIYIKRLQATRLCDGELSEGLVAMDPARLHLFRRRGKFVVIDATHHTNKLRWLLYTLMVRDEQGLWMPCAYMMTRLEDSDIVAAGLRQVSFIFDRASY